jgi:hypothetical protein
MKKEIIEITTCDDPYRSWCVNYNGATYPYESEEDAIKDAYAIYWLRQLEIRVDPQKQEKHSGIKIIINDAKSEDPREIAVNSKLEAFDIFLSRWRLFTSDAFLVAIKEKRNLKRKVFDSITISADPVMGKKQITVYFRGKSKSYQTFEDAEKEAEVLFWHRQFQEYFFPEKSGITGISLTKFKPRKDAETIYGLQDEEIERILKSWYDADNNSENTE